ncbi:MAG: hypothetical protein GXP38_17445 [Chloroflexi bacterium]|nr:hypothetical protein [Chloroflexota bacterium]
MPDTELDAVITNTRHCLTWVAICNHYLQRNPKEDFRDLLEELLVAEQQAVAELAGILRQHGIRPGDLTMLDSLYAQARVRKTDQARMRFIQQGLANSDEWYQTQIQASSPPLRELWQSLSDRQKAIEAKFSAILAQAG